MKTIVDDYLYTFDLQLDILELKSTSYSLHDFVVGNFESKEVVPVGYSHLVSTRLYNEYNFLMYPLPQVWELYHGIRDSFRSLVPNDPYFIQCWVNVYKENDFIEWHKHFDNVAGCWHGYYSVTGTGSVTSYRIPGHDQVDVVNKENQLVIGKSKDDLHRTYPWDGEGDRITIAYDIVPAMSINSGTNHWIPI